MKYIRLTTTDPYYNLAVEEYLMRHTIDDVFMLWQNAPSVIVGKNQNVYAEVNVSYAQQHDIRLARRITGGGAVYHDLGNINYTFITSSDRAKTLDFAYFTRPVIDALAELGLSCSLSGRNDLECDGRKISGNAQFSADGRILHHGTLLFDVCMEELSSALRVDKEKLAYKAVRSHKGRVANLATLLKEKMTVEELISHIEGYVLSQMGAEIVSPPDVPEIEVLRARNASDEWIFSARRYLTEYTVSRRKKYAFGIVQIELTLNGERIERTVISGDFFGTAPVEELERALVGKRVNEPLGIDPAPFIHGMTESELSALLTGEN